MYPKLFDIEPTHIIPSFMKWHNDFYLCFVPFRNFIDNLSSLRGMPVSFINK